MAVESVAPCGDLTFPIGGVYHPPGVFGIPGDATTGDRVWAFYQTLDIAPPELISGSVTVSDVHKPSEIGFS